jgi:hypothetical protein
MIYYDILCTVRVKEVNTLSKNWMIRQLVSAGSRGGGSREQMGGSRVQGGREQGAQGAGAGRKDPPVTPLRYIEAVIYWTGNLKFTFYAVIIIYCRSIWYTFDTHWHSLPLAKTHFDMSWNLNFERTMQSDLVSATCSAREMLVHVVNPFFHIPPLYSYRDYPHLCLLTIKHDLLTI